MASPCAQRRGQIRIAGVMRNGPPHTTARPSGAPSDRTGTCLPASRRGPTTIDLASQRRVWREPQPPPRRLGSQPRAVPGHPEPGPSRARTERAPPTYPIIAVSTAAAPRPVPPELRRARAGAEIEPLAIARGPHGRRCARSDFRSGLAGWHLHDCPIPRASLPAQGCH